MDKKLIYDVGMHNGDDTAYYLSLGYKVLAIDASPQLVEEANVRFERYVSTHQLEVLNVGIAREQGTMDFYLNKLSSVWNSFDKSIGTREGADVEVIKVRTEPMANIVREKGLPYYMKIDIEGHDILCLESLMDCTERPRFISVEVNGPELLLKLKELGYTKFKIIHQASLLPLELPEIREYSVYKKHVSFKYSGNIFVRIIRKLFGSRINKLFEKKYRHFFKYDHPYGSSGTFGDQLPGKWAGFDETMRIYEHYRSIHENSKQDTGYNYWIDAHATF